MSSLGFRCSVLVSFVMALCALVAPRPAAAQKNPYFIVYDHYLEEPGNLEVEYVSTFGTQRQGNAFHSFRTSLEYGATAWWTTEVYLDGQSTFGDSTLLTGFRWENRLRPLKREHWVNPLLYIEYVHVNGADKFFREIEGHDIESDFLTPNAEARREHKQEIELKLILSRNWKGWNFSENTLAAKNLSNNPWEFGYALGASRPLALKASAKRCTFCRENFSAGVEMYGGLGDRYSFGLRETSQYLAPAIGWNLPSGWAVRLSPGFGLNDNSRRFFLRWVCPASFRDSATRSRIFSGAANEGLYCSSDLCRGAPRGFRCSCPAGRRGGG